MAMDTHQKLKILADAAKYDASCASSGAEAAGQAKRDEPNPPYFAEWEKSVRVQISQAQQRY